MIKYHQKRDLSLEKTRAVEQKRHALLKQQLDTKVGQYILSLKSVFSSNYVCMSFCFMKIKPVP